MQAIIEAKKPLVGHNCMYDWLYCYNQFVAELPATYQCSTGVRGRKSDLAQLGCALCFLADHRSTQKIERAFFCEQKQTSVKMPRFAAPEPSTPRDALAVITGNRHLNTTVPYWTGLLYIIVGIKLQT